MIDFLGVYLLIGTVAAIDAGWAFRAERVSIPWYADALAFLAVAVLWMPIAAVVITRKLGRRR